MGIANLSNVPRSPEEISIFSFANQDEHTKANAAIFAKRGLTLPVYPLDPIPFTDIGVWAQNHQEMHDYVNGVLKTAGSDLTGVNFQDEGQLQSWIWLHANEHYSWQNILGTT